MEKTITIKSTGIIRILDDLGRVAIPKEIRRQLRIEEGTPIEIHPSSDGIYLTPYKGSFIDEHKRRSLVLTEEEFKEAVEAGLRFVGVVLDYIEFDKKSVSPVRVFGITDFPKNSAIEISKPTVFKALSIYFKYGRVNAIATDGASIIIVFEED